MAISAALGSSALLPAGLGFRNAIINGNMIVNQRGYTSASPVSVATGSQVYYSVDRWFGSGETSQGTYSLGQSTSVYPSSDTFPYSLHLACTAADTSLAANDDYEFGQSIEGYNVAQFGYGTSAAKQAVLSFWVRSSLTGTYCVAIRNGAANRSYIMEYTVNAADTWEKKTLYFNGDTTGTWAKDNTAGMIVTWALAMGSTYQTSANTWTAGNYLATSNQVNWMSSATSRTFYLTGVQLEQNYQPTPFEQRPYGVELALCQRYYWRFKQRAGGVYDQVAAAGITVSTTQVNRCTISLPVPTRRQVTNADVAVNAISIYDGTSIVSVTNVAATSMDVGATMMGFDATCGGILASGRPSVLIFTNDTGYFAVNQEL